MSSSALWLSAVIVLRMGLGRVRPLVRIDTHLSPDVVVKRVAASLRAPDCPVSGLVAEGRIELHARGEEQHFWSPQLIVEVRGTKRGSCMKGLFGPHPSVWTLYMAGYAACAFGALVGASFAYAQWVMEQPMWALYSVPAALIAVLVLYALAFVGQHAGSKQMHELKAFLEADVQKHESLAPDAQAGRSEAQDVQAAHGDPLDLS